MMKKNVVTRTLALVLTAVLSAGCLTGCTFGFASDPDDPNEVEEKEPIDKTDWLSMARTHLPQRVALKDYRSMSVELYAMEAVGLHWQRSSPSVNLLACTLGNILNGYVCVRTRRTRMEDLDPQGRDEEKVEKALAFWKKMTTI